jgi:hypothetical protein
MFATGHGNLVHNAGFDLWPWGTSGFAGVASDVNFGKTAARWFLQKTNGGTDAVTVSRGTNANTTDYDTWLHNKPHLELNVTALTANNTMKLRQFLDGKQDFGQTLMAVSIIASGPEGAYFYASVGDESVRITTRGDDPVSGYPIMDTHNFFVPFDNPVHDYLRITPFEAPSETGVYRLHRVQVEPVMESSWSGRGFEIRSVEDEWHLIRRYIQPVQGGDVGIGASSTQIRVPFKGPPVVGMRQTPVIPTEGRLATVNVALGSGGTAIVNSAPTFTFSTNPAVNNMGGSILIGGFTGGQVASASNYTIGPETAPICYLNADYY